MARIDPTARVADGARLGADVEIGPFCVVGPEVSLGDGCRLIAQVHVTGITAIGARTVIYPFASLGTPPQSVQYKGEPSRLVIGSDCEIREYVTANTGSAIGNMETRVGDRCFLMVAAHVGHDCIVGNQVILANGVTLGGHVEIGDHAFMGALTGVHQFARVGAHVIVAGNSGIADDIIPFAAALGHRAELGGLNVIGLKRRGFSREAIHSLRAAYRMLFFGEDTFAERLERTAQTFAGEENVQTIVRFIRSAGRRRIALPREQAEED